MLEKTIQNRDPDFNLCYFLELDYVMPVLGKILNPIIYSPEYLCVCVCQNSW